MVTAYSHTDDDMRAYSRQQKAVDGDFGILYLVFCLCEKPNPARCRKPAKTKKKREKNISIASSCCGHIGSGKGLIWGHDGSDRDHVFLIKPSVRASRFDLFRIYARAGSQCLVLTRS